MSTKKANSFYEILNSVEFNNPIDDKDEFFTDFSGLRKGFSENKIFKMLNINPSTKDCNELKTIQRIFLSGHRGTGKTTELLRLKNEINSTGCYLVVFCDLSKEELDMNNIDFVDIVIYMLEQLVSELKSKNIEIKTSDIESFYEWYKQRVVEINDKIDTSATIETEARVTIGIPALLGLITRTKAKLQASQDTKETIRRVFTNKFSDFSLKFNEFILSVKATIKEKQIAKDLLFIIDGFEKIGTLDARQKILIDNSNKFVEIQSNMMIALPIELFSRISTLSNFSTPISFPLITLDEGGMNKFREFICKRVDEALFEDGAIERIIQCGAGSPRETLKIIEEAYIAADGEKITVKSVEEAREKVSSEIVDYLTKEEIELLKELTTNTNIPYSDTLANLTVKKVVLEYGDGSQKQINPIVSENEKFQKFIEVV